MLAGGLLKQRNNFFSFIGLQVIRKDRSNGKKGEGICICVKNIASFLDYQSAVTIKSRNYGDQSNQRWNFSMCIISSVRRILKRGGRNFRKFEKNKDQNKKLFHPNSVQFFAQNQVKSKKKKKKVITQT